MKKRVNFRLPFAAAVAVAAGICMTYFVYRYSLPQMWLNAPLLIFALLACFAAVKLGVKVLVYLAITALFLMGGMGVSSALFAAYSRPNAAEGHTVAVVGRVASVKADLGGGYVVMTGVTINGEALDGKAVAFFDTGDYCERGYTVSFTGNMDRCELISRGSVSYWATEGVKYRFTVHGRMDADYAFSPFGALHGAMRDALYGGADGETAGVCLAMLTGDSLGVSEGVMDSFRYGGMAHIFAVSGLHISILYSALTMLFRLLRVRRIPSAVIRLLLIFFYSGVCCFTPSSVRAAVMCAVNAAAGFLFAKYDSLNGLSIAVILLLLINPFMFFDVGFRLSVCAVLGIVLLSGNMERLLSPLPEKLRSGLSVALSAQLATLPVLMSSFGYVSAAGLLLSIVVLPLLSLVYIAVFAGVMLAIIMPFAAKYIVFTVTLPMAAYINFSAAAGFENALIYGTLNAVMPLLVFIFACGVTDKLNIRAFWRVVLTCSVALCVAVWSAGVRSYAFGNAKIMLADGAAIIRTDEGVALILQEDYVGEDLKLLSRSFCGETPSALVVIGGDGSLSQYFAAGGGYDSVYIRGGGFTPSFIGGARVISLDGFTLYGAEYAFTDGDLCVTVNGLKMDMCACGTHAASDVVTLTRADGSREEVALSREGKITFTVWV